MFNKLKIVIITFSLLLTLSCGGGGGGDEGDNKGGNVQSDGDVLNLGLTGKFFHANKNGVWLLDAAKGTYEWVQDSDHKNQTNTDRFWPGCEPFVSATRNNNREFLVVVPEFLKSYVYSQYYDGQFSDVRFRVEGEISSANMSDDGQYIAAFVQVGSISNPYWFSIYSRDGALLSERMLSRRYYIWLSDHRILYSEGRTFYFTAPASAEAEYSLTLKDATNEVWEGRIGGKTVSPDNTKVAFTLFTPGPFSRVDNARLFMMNIDGTDVRLLATTYNDEDPRLLAPEWSPDGRWIFVEEGYIPPAGTDHDGYVQNFGYRYIVPADGPVGKVYYLSENDNERSPEVSMFWRYGFSPEPAGITAQGSSARYVWIPSPE